MARPVTSDPDEFLRHLVKCIDYQGVRATARKLGWHPSKVSRARHRFQGLTIYDLIRLAEAAGGYVNLTIPTTRHLTKARRGRPPGSFSDLIN